VTVWPAVTGLGLAWTATGGVRDSADAGAASSVSIPTVAANRTAAVILAGRMATSLC
jgi:hypothetical protein